MMNDKLLKAISWQGKLQPTFILPLTRPEALGSAAVRRTVGRFLETGVSSHSSAGATLWALLDYLQRSGIPYTLYAHPGFGYEVRRAEPLAGLES